MATDIFLFFGPTASGSKIKGESKDAEFEGAIEITEWSWSFQQVSTMASGGGGGAGKVTLEGIELGKFMDLSTPALAIKCCSGEHIAEAKLVQRKAAGTEPLQYLFISMKTVMVQSISHSSSGEQPSEKLKLSFAEYELKYIEQKDDGKAGTTKDVKYSLKQNKVLKDA